MNPAAHRAAQALTVVLAVLTRFPTDAAELVLNVLPAVTRLLQIGVPFTQPAMVTAVLTELSNLVTPVAAVQAALQEEAPVVPVGEVRAVEALTDVPEVHKGVTVSGSATILAFPEHSGLAVLEMSVGMPYRMLKFIAMLQEHIYAKEAATEVLTNATKTRLNVWLNMQAI